MLVRSLKPTAEEPRHGPPTQVLLVTHTAVKVKGQPQWIHNGGRTSIARSSDVATFSNNANIDQGKAQERSCFKTQHTENAQYNFINVSIMLVIGACCIIFFYAFVNNSKDLRMTDNERNVERMLWNRERMDGQPRHVLTLERMIKCMKRATTMKSTKHEPYMDVGTLKTYL